MPDIFSWFQTLSSGQSETTFRWVQAEEALQQSNERFQLVTRATSDAVWDWNVQTSEIWWNDGFQKLFGYTPQGTGGTIEESWTCRVHPDDVDRVSHSLHRAVDQAQGTLDAVLLKARYWQQWATIPLSERQVKLLNRLLDGFDGKLTTSKWAAIAKCSPDTALRDISDLLTRGVLRKTAAGGRSTSYELNDLRV